MSNDEKFIEELVASLRQTLAHAEQMTEELAQTDDLSDYPYIMRARRLLKRAEKRRKK